MTYVDYGLLLPELKLQMRSRLIYSPILLVRSSFGPTKAYIVAIAEILRNRWVFEEEGEK